MIDILETDQLFSDSPDTGHPDCKCSRCLKVIPEQQVPTRIWPTDDEGNVLNYEYRFCNKCSGFTFYSSINDF
jgi:hypothetical protein